MTLAKTASAIALLSATAIVAADVAIADEYPTKTIEVVTHAGNGGGTDVTTRMMMLRARRELGQDMVIVNKRAAAVLRHLSITRPCLRTAIRS